MAAMRGMLLTIAVCAAAIAGCGGGGNSSSTGSTGESPTVARSAETQSSATKPKVEVPSGPPPKKLESKELIEGTGAVAKAGDKVTVQQSGSTTRPANSSTPDRTAANRSPSRLAPAK
jgi:hypothetical protein